MSNNDENDRKQVEKLLTTSNGSIKNKKEVNPLQIDKITIDIFLKEVLKRSSLNISQKDMPLFSSYDEIIQYILKETKATEYIGVGVGCVLLNKEKTKVLLYKRNKNPEKNKWSILGGGVKYSEECKLAALREFSNITGVNLTGQEKKFNLLFLRVNNHYPQKSNKKEDTLPRYHYVSPAYYFEIVDDSLWSIIDGKFPDDGRETPFKNKFELEKIKNGHKGNYSLKWFPIKDIPGNNDFSNPTISAIEAFKKYSTRVKIASEISLTSIEKLNSFEKILKNQLEKVSNLFEDTFYEIANS